MLFPLRDFNPTRTAPVLTVLLIAVNIAVFLLPLVSAPRSEPMPLKYGMIPWEITRFQSAVLELSDSRGRIFVFQRDTPPVLTLFSSLFIHGGLIHLLGNMLFLWIFGNNIEDRLGKVRFLLFYLACGLGASLVHVAFHSASKIPVVGASGAISGIMGAYLILFPTARVRTLVFLFFFITFVDLPAAVFLLIWFFYQFLYAGGGGGIAWLAHVGGFVIGFLLVRNLVRSRRLS